MACLSVSVSCLPRDSLPGTRCFHGPPWSSGLLPAAATWGTVSFYLNYYNIHSKRMVINVEIPLFYFSVDFSTSMISEKIALHV